jgi:hypothetical protein
MHLLSLYDYRWEYVALIAAFAVFAIVISRLFHRDREDNSAHERAERREDWYYNTLVSADDYE